MLRLSHVAPTLETRTLGQSSGSLYSAMIHEPGGVCSRIMRDASLRFRAEAVPFSVLLSFEVRATLAQSRQSLVGVFGAEDHLEVVELFL